MCGPVLGDRYYEIGRTGLQSLYPRQTRAIVWAKEIKKVRQTAGRSADDVARVALAAADLGYKDAQSLMDAAFPRKAPR